MDTNEPAFFKVGGSVFDEMTSKRHPDAVQRAVRNICYFHDAHPHVSVFVTLGGGPPGDVLSAWHAPGDVLTLSSSAADYLRGNAKLLCSAFAGRAERVDPDDFAPASIGSRKIQIIPYAPKQARVGQLIYDLREEPIDLGRVNKSDLQTLMTACFVGAREVVYIKHTDGIYPRDPNVRHLFRTNRRIEEISAADLLLGRKATTVRGRQRSTEVTRQGADGRDDHLCESIALRYMECVGPERIFVTSWWDDWGKPGNPAERIYVTRDPRGISRIVRAYATDCRRAA